MIVDNKHRVSWQHSAKQSQCIVEFIEESGVVRIISVIARLHPKDHFDRKKGILESFKKVMQSKVGDIYYFNKKIRTMFWREFWKIREKKIKIVEMQFQRNVSLEQMLETMAGKATDAKTGETIYTFPNNSKEVYTFRLIGRIE